MVRNPNPDAELYSDKTIHADLLTTFIEKVNELKNRVSEIPGKCTSISFDLSLEPLTFNSRAFFSCKKMTAIIYYIENLTSRVVSQLWV